MPKKSRLYNKPLTSLPHTTPNQRAWFNTMTASVQQVSLLPEAFQLLLQRETYESEKSGYYRARPSITRWQ